MKHPVVITAAALSSACSMLIEFDDGLGEDQSTEALGGSAPSPAAPDGGVAAGAGGSDAGVGSGALGGSGGVDDPDAGPSNEPPVYDLAILEDPEESNATLHLVSSELALRSGPDGAPPSRITLRPATQAGDVLDFAWSPDATRIAVRYVDLRGTQLAIFSAPDWTELPRDEAVSPAALPDLDVTANYRWSPSSDALAFELEGEAQPLVSAYVIEGDEAFGVEPVLFAGPIEAMDWRSATSLYVIQPQDGDPELLDLRLNQRAFETPVALFSVLFFPVELRRVPGGLLAEDDDPSSLNFWPESADHGSESAFTITSYLSGKASFVAEIIGTSAQISPIGAGTTVIDAVPSCPTVLTWIEGPDRRSLAGAKIACLSPADPAPSISVHSYDESSVRTAVTLQHDALSAGFAATESWEAHARAFSPGGEFLALATAAHDVLVDLRGPEPSFRVEEVATPGGTARGFSPSGDLLLQQRGRDVELVLLSPAGGAPISQALPPAFAGATPCVTAQHDARWCGGAGAAERASGRWSRASDVAAFLAEGEGLFVLRPTSGAVGFERESVSTCGAGCVTRYEFGR